MGALLSPLKMRLEFGGKMADPNQLARISVKPKALESFTVPNLPRLPDRFVRQFDLKGWQDEMEVWRQNLQNGIREALVSIKSQS